MIREETIIQRLMWLPTLHKPSLLVLFPYLMILLAIYRKNTVMEESKMEQQAKELRSPLPFLVNSPIF